MKALSKDTSHRYKTASQMGRALVDIGQNNKQAAAESLLQNNLGTSKTPQTNIHTGQISEIDSLEGRATAGSTAYRSSISTSPEKSKNRIDDLLEIDWIIWVLVILALVTGGGLIPFWLWVYYTLNPP